MTQELQIPQSPNTDKIQTLWAENLLVLQAELLSLLYQNEILDPYIKKNKTHYHASNIKDWSVQDWNKYKKIYKISLKEINELIPLLQVPLQEKCFETIEKILTLRLNIINSFIPLIQFLARRYSPHNYSLYLDLKSEGYIGLLKSLESFYYIEVGKSIKSYSMFYIKQEMRRYLLENKQGFKIPYIASLKQKKDREENTVESLEISKVQYFSELSNSNTPSYENQIISDIQDPFFNTWEHSLEKILEKVLLTLPPNEKKVLELRYGLGTESLELSLGKIGEILSLSKERVRQIEKKALEHLYQRTKGIFKKEDLSDVF